MSRFAVSKAQLLSPRRGRRRLFAPEVVQTSPMDCGPAALKCLLDGFGIHVSYARLQEACRTDVDGTSINTIEKIAVAVGLEAEQVVVPIDHVLLDRARALPALAVVRRDHMTHFLIAWRRDGPFVQLMDPARGRRWVRHNEMLKELLVHHESVPATAWREWAGSEDFLGCVAERLHAIGVPEAMCEHLLQSAAADSSWHALATLDASTRMVTDLVRARGLQRGAEAGRLIEVFSKPPNNGRDQRELIPSGYWSVLPDEQSQRDSLILRGAILLCVRERRAIGDAAGFKETAPPRGDLPENLTRALTEEPERPMTQVGQIIRRNGLLTPGLLAIAVPLIAVGTLFEILLLRGFLDIHNVLSVREHRLAAMGLLLGLVGSLLVVELAISGVVLRLGRWIEVRLRATLQEKLPKIGDQYFHSRLVSDMAHRAHSLDAVRELPDLAANVVRASIQLIFTAIALAWLDPPSAWIAVSAAVLMLVIPLATEPILAEGEMRQRNHSAALCRHYLDSLLGLVAARTSSAERALRRRHEDMIADWRRSSLHLLRGGLVIEGIQALAGSGLAVWLVVNHVSRGGQLGTTLLLVYWALSLPSLGRELAAMVRRFPAHHNTLARVLELLHAPEEASPVPEASEFRSRGASIALDNVHVEVAGQPVLGAVTLSIQPGEHVAIVGRSGAGKSTLVGLLLGERTPSTGCIVVDDAPLDAERLLELRRSVAWIDPAIQIWNRSLFDNLRYGDSAAMVSDIGSILETAQLTELVDKLPEGLQSSLGEGGGLTSGGEGEQVRFGRALVRRHVRLAILDEPFRGLDRQKRRELLGRARDIWRDATLLCVTHDIEDTLAFDRVLVLEKGHLVEDGNPVVLSRTPGSRYGALLSAEEAVTQLWSSEGWRRWQLRNGTLVEESSGAESPWSLRRSLGV